MDTTLRECQRCNIETDCIEGFCQECKLGNDYWAEEIAREKEAERNVDIFNSLIK